MLASDAVYLYDAESARLLRRIGTDALTQHSKEHCLPDMALDRSGNAFVSSAMQPTLMRIDAATFEVTHQKVQVDSDHGKDFGFSALTFVGQTDTLYAASATIGALWKIDHLQNRAAKVELSHPVYGACALSAAPADSQSQQSPTDEALLVAGGFRDGVKRVELFGMARPYRVTTITTTRALIVPTDFAVVRGKLLVVLSRLSQHPDFDGDGQLHSQFSIVPIDAPH